MSGKKLINRIDHCICIALLIWRRLVELGWLKPGVAQQALTCTWRVSSRRRDGATTMSAQINDWVEYGCWSVWVVRAGRKLPSSLSVRSHFRDFVSHWPLVIFTRVLYGNSVSPQKLGVPTMKSALGRSCEISHSCKILSPISCRNLATFSNGISSNGYQFWTNDLSWNFTWQIFDMI